MGHIFVFLFAIYSLAFAGPLENKCFQYTCEQLASSGANLSGHECYNNYIRCINRDNFVEESIQVDNSKATTTTTSQKIYFPRKTILANPDTKLQSMLHNHESLLATDWADPNKADIGVMNQTFIKLFSKVRNYYYDPKYKEFVQKAVINTFISYGLEAEQQKFQMSGWGGSHTPKNLIGILPSANYKKKGDHTFVIGGHYDTVYGSPGVDDNGSGSVLVMEAARVLSKYKGKLNATIYFVLFDQEETGLHGSAAFVKSYYIPKVLDRLGGVHKGAYIADMVLSYDPAPNSQIVSKNIERMTPEAAAWIKQNSYRGDFISVMSRKGIDTELWMNLKDAWEETNSSQYKMLVMDAPIPAEPTGSSLIWSDFHRSDHVSFWSSSRYHRHVKTLSAVFLWDLGPWRGYIRNCYHRACDNTVQLTQENMNFMAKVANSVISSTLKIAKKV